MIGGDPLRGEASYAQPRRAVLREHFVEDCGDGSPFAPTQRNTMSDKTAQHVHDLVEDAFSKATGIAEQARTAVDGTVADAKAVLRDLDGDAAIAAARELAGDTAEKVSAAYKRNPRQVLVIGAIAVAGFFALNAMAARRR
jgi:hypothetical protein